MKQHLQAVWRFILEMLFPAFCLGCRKEGNFLCDDCFAALPRGSFASEKSPGCFALDGVISCSSYKDGALLARAIHSLKYEYVKDLAEPLGRLMAEALPSDLKETVFCPVPLHRKRFRWRGFNQAELLTRVMIERDESIKHLLKRTTFKKPQMELSREDRLLNVNGAFSVAEDVAKISHVILVDDVATTMATLEACAVSLKASGVPKVTAIVLARVH